MGKAPEHPGYVKMKDTPWIKQGRKIASAGGEGILDNYNNVNVFNQATRDSLEAMNNSIYQRAFSDMNQKYNDTMNAYNARNFGRFGTLQSTPASYTTDEYQKDFQRQMNDLSYNKAMNYENLINNELNRRYNTLNMYQNLYNYGQTPYSQDVNNWNIENTNRDINYKNKLVSYQNNSQAFGNTMGGAVNGAVKGFVTTGNPWGALAGGVAGGLGGYFGNNNNMASGGRM